MSASTDISKLISGLGEARERGRAAARRGLAIFANHVIGDSQQLTPVKTGALQASGTVGEVEQRGDSFAVTIGHNTSYAAAVHEGGAEHAVGQSKFLETAVRNNAPKLVEFVGNEVKKVL